MRPVYKAPPPVAVYSWSGFYVGANVGYSWGRSSNDWDFFAPSFFVLPGSTTCLPAGLALCLAGSDSNKLNGVIGGLQAGYNWQAGQFLVGIETDIQATGQKGDRIFSGGFPVDPQVPPSIVEATYTQKLQWIGTLRGRVGFATNQTLLYATGGLAYGPVTVNGYRVASTCNFIGDQLCPLRRLGRKLLWAMPVRELEQWNDKGRLESRRRSRGSPRGQLELEDRISSC